MSKDETGKWVDYLTAKLTKTGKKFEDFTDDEKGLLVGFIEGQTLSPDGFNKFTKLLDLDKDEQIAFLDQYLPYAVARRANLTSWLANKKRVASDFDVQMSRLQSNVASLETRIQGSLEGGPMSTIDYSQAISELRKTVDEIKTTGDKLTAPVRIPTPKEMTVSLVPTTSLERLEEYRSDEAVWFAGLGLSLGALLSVFVNLGTGGTADTNTLIITALLVIGSVVSGYQAWTLRQRGNKIKDTILKSNDEESESS